MNTPSIDALSKYFNNIDNSPNNDIEAAKVAVAADLDIRRAKLRSKEEKLKEEYQKVSAEDIKQMLNR